MSPFPFPRGWCSNVEFWRRALLKMTLSCRAHGALRVRGDDEMTVSWGGGVEQSGGESCFLEHLEMVLEGEQFYPKTCRISADEGAMRASRATRRTGAVLGRSCWRMRRVHEVYLRILPLSLGRLRSSKPHQHGSFGISWPCSTPPSPPFGALRSIALHSSCVHEKSFFLRKGVHSPAPLVLSL